MKNSKKILITTIIALFTSTSLLSMLDSKNNQSDFEEIDPKKGQYVNKFEKIKIQDPKFVIQYHNNIDNRTWKEIGNSILTQGIEHGGIQTVSSLIVELTKLGISKGIESGYQLYHYLRGSTNTEEQHIILENIIDMFEKRGKSIADNQKIAINALNGLNKVKETNANPELIKQMELQSIQNQVIMSQAAHEHITSWYQLHNLSSLKENFEEDPGEEEEEN